MNMNEVEQAARQAWPALEELELSFGVLRYARGIDRRSNSLSLYPEASFEPARAISKAERFFARRGVSSIVRIVESPRASFPLLVELDQLLKARGYEKQSPTLSMLLNLDMFSGTQAANAAEQLDDIQLWLRAWYGLTARDLDGMDVHLNTLNRIFPADRICLHRLAGGNSASTGMGVISGDAVGLFGIATARSARRQGHAAAVINALLSWAKSKKAKFAYLQVESANTAALELYKKFGFRELYSYWYRVAENRVEG